MSEEQTWRSEDTGVFSFKVFFGAGLPPPFAEHSYSPHRAGALSEAKCIVFAAEGLFLAHGSPFNCGNGLDSPKAPSPYYCGEISASRKDDYFSFPSALSSCCA